MTSTLPGRFAPAETTPEELTRRYLEVRSRTEELAAPLGAEDQTVQSMPDVSPTKWHRAHVTWFFEAFVLSRFAPDYRVFHPGYAYLFNSYYEALGARHPRPARGLVSRPGISEIARYRRFVDDAVVALLESASSSSLDPEAAFLIELGCNHEEQHQELLLMDAKHVLSQSPLDPAYKAPVEEQPGTQAPEAKAAGVGWIAHPGGEVEIGDGGGGFAFDNERPRHVVRLEPFELAEALVTCGSWRAFIDDGGYRRPELWLSDGWATLQRERWEAPLYWRDEGGGSFSVFTLAGRREVDDAEPVCHVSYYEADAFARWAKARLATEQEWEAVARACPVEGNFLGSGRLHPVAGPGRLYGDAWAWTASAYLPYPRFRPEPGAVGEYNGKFMVNQHVLRGGSCVTPEGHVRPSYRNFFPPGARWPFTGVRLARDGPEAR
jgi:ergothioneine biosynthesis protein EgtB